MDPAVEEEEMKTQRLAVQAAALQTSVRNDHAM